MARQLGRPRTVGGKGGAARKVQTQVPLKIHRHIRKEMQRTGATEAEVVRDLIMAGWSQLSGQKAA